MIYRGGFNRNFVFILGVFCVTILLNKVESRPSPEEEDYSEGVDDYDKGGEDRNKRILGIGTALDYRGAYKSREDRRSPPYSGYGPKTTYPPFPGDDDDYYRYITTEDPYRRREPETAPPLYTPSTSESYIYNGNNNEIELERSKEDKPFHRKIVPWFKRQWGHTRDFFNNLG